MNKFIESDNVMNVIPKGAFLVSGDEEINVMTIGWGMVGVMWFKPVFVLPVRQSRYTKNLIDKTGYFTISVPYGDNMKSAIAFCGSKSGRDVDKFQGASIKPKKAKEINSYVVDECDMYYECKVLYKTTLEKDNLLQEEAAHYINNDMHTLYYAEIITSYKK